MDLLFHAWIGSLMYAFSSTGLFTYGSIFPRIDWLSHICFLTHGPFHLWVYFSTHGLALSRMLSHAWAFSRIGVFFHAWIGSLTYSFSHMGLFTNGSTFPRTDWLFHVCFLTNGPFYLWVYSFTHELALLRMLSHAWAFSRMGLLFHAWIGFLTYAFSRTGLFTYGSPFPCMDWLSHVCCLTHGPFLVWFYFSCMD